MRLEDLKIKAKERISSLDELREKDAEDFEIDGIGTLKITWAMPREYMNLAMDRLAVISATDTPDSEKTMDYFKSVVKLCAIDPVLDDEAIELLVDSMGVKFAELANRCIELSSQSVEPEEAIEAVENFSEQTDGPSNDSE